MASVDVILLSLILNLCIVFDNPVLAQSNDTNITNVLATSSVFNVLPLLTSTTRPATTASSETIKTTTTRSLVLIGKKESYPDWYIQGIIEPLDVQIAEESKYQRDVANGSIRAKFVPTQEIVDFRQICALQPNRAKLFASSLFYKAIYNYDNWEVYKYSRLSLMYAYSSLFIFLVPLCTTLLSTLVLRKLSAQGDAHVYIYYNAVNGINTIIYGISVLESTGLLRLLELPLCSTGVYVALTFTGFATYIYPTLLDCCFGLSCMIQAVLAVDRFLAMFAPIIYHKVANKRAALFSVALCTIICLLTLLFHNFTTGYAQYNSCACSAGLNQALITAGRSAAGFLLGIALCTQALFCSAVFAKVIERKIHQMKGREGKTGQTAAYGLHKFSMLIGTCLVNIVGGSFLLGYHLCNDLIVMTGSIPQSQCLAFFQNTLLYSVTMCSSAGFFVHCICCKQFRVHAARISCKFIENGLAKLFPNRKIVIKPPKLRFGTSVGPSSGTGITMTTRQTQALQASFVDVERPSLITPTPSMC